MRSEIPGFSENKGSFLIWDALREGKSLWKRVRGQRSGKFGAHSRDFREIQLLGSLAE